MYEWLNFRIFFQISVHCAILCMHFMHCRSYHSDSHANHFIMNYYSDRSQNVFQEYVCTSRYLIQALFAEFRRILSIIENISKNHVSTQPGTARFSFEADSYEWRRKL